MRHVAPVRKELGVTTLMNLLGPLANPAGVRRQVIGVADERRGPLVAHALGRLGVDHALVVYGRVGMDEVSPVGETAVWEVRAGEVKSWTLHPEDYGLAVRDTSALHGAEPAANAERLERLLEDGADPEGRAALLLNAAAAIYVAGLVERFADGVAAAHEALDSGAARAALERLRRSSPSSGG
jgi:anthranilate phosphoribosyltransferase